jgi:hypothetical protein
MRPNVRVTVEETDHNGAHRWLVALIDSELVNPHPERRAVVYGALTEDEAVEVSHAVASAVQRVWRWWGHDR